MDFAGDFETHVTVHPAAGAVAGWAAARGLKFVHIVLDRGRVASQPMLTLRTRGTLAGALAAARTVADLRADGFEATRVKVEAARGTRASPPTTPTRSAPRTTSSIACVEGPLTGVRFRSGARWARPRSGDAGRARPGEPRQPRPFLMAVISSPPAVSPLSSQMKAPPRPWSLA
ncbi:hypothetical protein F8568_038770 [Actinomadura sp. LD22]|uniref:Uncharacterized protein n=1 Tax=Actinomadura physcomitrii TaxID=2650748 RepID=A0A6I4MKR8_9ACTN|nr:hypothetical protein [Actinomadura physcomitrii]MWA06193.1 hypothetical protein [Actinomadura physcomitrii]